MPEGKKGGRGARGILDLAPGAVGDERKQATRASQPRQDVRLERDALGIAVKEAVVRVGPDGGGELIKYGRTEEVDAAVDQIAHKGLRLFRVVEDHAGVIRHQAAKVVGKRAAHLHACA